jgi:tRNA(Ile)-lysidine synthase
LLHLAYDCQSGSVLALPGHIEAAKEFSHLILTKGATRHGFQGFSYRIAVPGAVDVLEIGSRFCCEIVRIPLMGAEYNNKCAVLLNDKLLDFPLTLRNWHAGDGYRPQGREKRKKLKELFREKRITVSDRMRWPVLLAGDDVIWARGFQPDIGFVPAEHSTQAILISEVALQ